MALRKRDNLRLCFRLIDVFKDLKLTPAQRKQVEVQISELDRKNQVGSRHTVLLNSTESFEASFVDMVGEKMEF